MFSLLQSFRKQETGAVTVDWVVLTAALVGLAAGTFMVVEAQSVRLAGETTGLLSQQDNQTQIPPLTP